MLRRYDPEFLEEMKGIADGAAAAGAEVHGRKVDLVDVVTMNSAIDLDSMEGALPVTPSAVTGRSFLSAEDELAVPDRVHKCSSLTATGPATADGRPVFFQIFMWDGYTGLHFNVVLDVVPEKGHRFVMQTFPGGIHSGTDFYMNDAGILIGETTVLQTPFDAEGTPQSNRIRKAIQYGSSVDEVAAILREKNNGMYTNDWTLADVKRDESAILLLGTGAVEAVALDRPAGAVRDAGLPVGEQQRARRGGAPRGGGAARGRALGLDVHARRTATWPSGASTRSTRGRSTCESAIGLMASSPINRPHACDGKVTDAQMAEKLVFMAHQGKVTLREKFPAAGSRRMPDLPGAVPHLTYGYATFSPIVIAEQLKAAHAAQAAAKAKAPATTETKAVADRYAFTRDDLWHGTFFPASDADNWLVAGSAAYWQILRGLPEKAADRPDALARALGGLRSRLAYVTSREADVAAAKGGVAYDRYAPALVPRVKGAFALHQLRLLSGNKAFFAFMKDFHARHRGQEVTTAQFLAAARESLGRDVEADLRPWLDRTGVPDPGAGGRRCSRRARSGASPSARRSRPRPTASPRPSRWRPATQRFLFPMTVEGAKGEAAFTVPEKPRRVVFDALADFPAATDRHYAFSSFAEDFARTLIVYGTGRQVEANHTLALRFQSVLADAFSETLPPVVQDAEVDEAELAAHDLFVLGDPRDNALLARAPAEAPRRVGTGLLPLPGSDVRRRAGRPLPRPAEPLRDGARAARPPRQQPAPAVRDDEGVPGRDAGVGGLPGREGREGGALPGRALLSRGEVTA